MQSLKDYEDDAAQGSMRITDLANEPPLQPNESGFDLNQFEIESLTAFEQDGGTKLQYISSLSQKSDEKADQIINQVDMIISQFD